MQNVYLKFSRLLPYNLAVWNLSHALMMGQEPVSKTDTRELKCIKPCCYEGFSAATEGDKSGRLNIQ